MENDWIKEAFEKATDEFESSYEIAKRCAEILQKQNPILLDVWEHGIGKETMVKVALTFKDERMLDALCELGKTFLTAGYCSALDDIKHGRIKV